MRSSTHRGFTLIELLVVIAIIAILAAILFPVFAKAREKARQTQCINNQKQFATAVQIYTQENEETMPEAKTFWADIDVPAKVKQCPTAGKKVSNAYVYNGSLSGVGLGELEYPVETLLTADGQGTAKDDDTNTAIDETRYANVAYDAANFALKRHGGFVIASYVDGHVGLTYEPKALLKISLWDLDKMPSQVASSPWPWSNGYSATMSTDALQGKACLKVSFNQKHIDLIINGGSGAPWINFAKSTRTDRLAIHYITVMAKPENTPFPSYLDASIWDNSSACYHIPCFNVNGTVNIDQSGWQEMSTLDITDTATMSQGVWIEGGDGNAVIDGYGSMYGFQTWGVGSPNEGAISPAAVLYLDDVCAWAESVPSKSTYE